MHALCYDNVVNTIHKFFFLSFSLVQSTLNLLSMIFTDPVGKYCVYCAHVNWVYSHTSDIY